MQPSGRRRRRTGIAREYGLIVFDIPRIGFALAGDIGRQRHLALRGNGRIQRRVGKANCDFRFATLAARHHLRRQAIKYQRIAGHQLAGRPRQGQKTIGRRGGDAAGFRLPAGPRRPQRAVPPQPGSDHACH